MRISSSLILFGVLFAFSVSFSAEPEEIARGGLLYDKWFKVTGQDAPKGKHPLYPATGAYAGKGSSTARCKECHGWDYKGKDGAYASGKHFTGIKGVLGVKTAKKGVAAAFDQAHKFDLKPGDRKALFAFLATIEDMAKDISPETNLAKGDIAKGKGYYQTLCAGCHGSNGVKEDMPDLGAVARKNPWEALHKTLYGQPATSMPALIALDRQISVDIVAYMQSLKAEK